MSKNLKQALLGLYNELNNSQKLDIFNLKEINDKINEAEREYLEKDILPLLAKVTSQFLSDLKNCPINIAINKSIEGSIEYSCRIDSREQITGKIEIDNTIPKPITTIRYVKKTNTDPNRSKIWVKLPDGSIIYEQSQVIDTLRNVIRYIGYTGVEEIYNNRVSFVKNNNLILRMNDIRDGLVDIDRYESIGKGYYLLINTSTQVKFEQISELNEQLSLGLNVKLIAPGETYLAERE